MTQVVIYAAAGNIASGDVGAEQGQSTHSPATALVHSISAFATITSSGIVRRAVVTVAFPTVAVITTATSKGSERFQLLVRHRHESLLVEGLHFLAGEKTRDEFLLLLLIHG